MSEIQNKVNFLWIFAILSQISFTGHGEAAETYDVPFVEGCTYELSVPDPTSVLGYPLGTRPATYNETWSYFQTLGNRCKNVRLYTYGETHEGRKLILLVISSPENMARLDSIKEKIGKLTDPRKLQNEEEAQAILEKTPAVAWLAYSIHGDELSSTDAAIWVAYQLAAGQDSVTQKILRDTVVCIDPMQNPDGRERSLAQIRSFNGKVNNPDAQSAQHIGMWPWGRGNHYFFDLNRDFFILSQPETRARVKAFQEWNPQLFVDSHEMGPLDTYLFSPPREPINRNLTPMHKKWSQIFAEEQAQAFDRHGWSYYTREWLDMLYPGYTEWIAYRGALMILYEQAGVNGSSVRRADGTTMTYRETVHHHITSSLANLKTLASRRSDVLRDYYEQKRKEIQPLQNGEVCAYLIEPATNTTRARRLVENLLDQGIEIDRADRDFSASGLTGVFGERLPDKKFPAGTWIVPARQPVKNLLHAVLEFDPRLKDSYLQEERFYLEKKNETRLYDVSAWSMPIAYGVDCWQATATIEVPQTRITELDAAPAPPPLSRPQYGYVLSGSDDSATIAVTRLLEAGFAVRISERPFRVGALSFPTGSFLLRKVENPERLHEAIQSLRRETGVKIIGADTALDLEGVDLGGGYFTLLTPPRIGIVMGRTINVTSYGATWNWLDNEYHMRVSSLDADILSWLDLRKYNLLILPSADNVGALKSVLEESGLKRIKQWVENGGTLIALGSSVSLFTDPKADWSSARERGEVLDQLYIYEEAAEREAHALIASASQADIWDYHPKEIQSATGAVKKKPDDIESLKRQDAWERRFSPHGAFLRVQIDPYHWLGYGVRSPLAVMVNGSNSYYAKPPVENPVRFTGEADIRVSGLLWPEARRRFAGSVYLTREGKGKGQLILFPYEPHERGYYPETTRLLWNAVFLGPGIGAETPLPW